MRSTSEEAQNVVPALFEKMGGYHPNEPHWYLPLLGVDPHHHGKGLGSVLMKYALTMCDKDSVLGYIESSNPRNIPFYKRHGFELLGTIQENKFPQSFQCFASLNSYCQINSNQHYNGVPWRGLCNFSKND